MVEAATAEAPSQDSKVQHNGMTFANEAARTAYLDTPGKQDEVKTAYGRVQRHANGRECTLEVDEHGRFDIAVKGKDGIPDLKVGCNTAYWATGAGSGDNYYPAGSKEAFYKFVESGSPDHYNQNKSAMTCHVQMVPDGTGGFREERDTSPQVFHGVSRVPFAPELERIVPHHQPSNDYEYLVMQAAATDAAEWIKHHQKASFIDKVCDKLVDMAEGFFTRLAENIKNASMASASMAQAAGQVTAIAEIVETSQPAHSPTSPQPSALAATQVPIALIPEKSAMLEEQRSQDNVPSPLPSGTAPTSLAQAALNKGKGITNPAYNVGQQATGLAASVKQTAQDLSQMAAYKGMQAMEGIGQVANQIASKGEQVVHTAETKAKDTLHRGRVLGAKCLATLGEKAHTAMATTIDVAKQAPGKLQLAFETAKSIAAPVTAPAAAIQRSGGLGV